MKQFTPTLSSLSNGFAILLLGVVLLPLLILSFYNHPSAADDFCFADTALKYGVWQAQKFYYDGWTGRYFANLIFHTSPLVWGWYDGFRFLPALMLLLWLGSHLALIGELMPTFPLGVRLAMTAWLFFLYILVLPSTTEAYFWFSAVAVYTVPSILTIYLFVVMIRWYRIRRQPLKTLTLVWACFLVFATVGSGETNLVIVILGLVGILAYRLLFQRTFDSFIAILLVVALFSTWLVFRAPGNAIRMGGNPQGGNILLSAVSSFRYLATSVFHWLTQTPLLILSVLWLPIARRLARPDNPARIYVALPPWIVTVAFIGLLAAIIFPSYYGVGIDPTLRVMNVTYAFFLLGWFFTLTVWVVYADRKGWLTNRVPISGSVVAMGLAVLWIGFSLFRSEPLRQQYRDLLSGKAAAYNREMVARHGVLSDKSRDTVRLAPISARPVTLFYSDMEADAKHLWNRCEAGYYGKKAVYLEPLTAGEKTLPSAGE